MIWNRLPNISGVSFLICNVEVMKHILESCGEDLEMGYTQIASQLGCFECCMSDD